MSDNYTSLSNEEKIIYNLKGLVTALSDINYSIKTIKEFESINPMDYELIKSKLIILEKDLEMQNIDVSCMAGRKICIECTISELYGSMHKIKESK